MSSLSIRKTNKKSTLKHKNEFKLNGKIVRRRLFVEFVIDCCQNILSIKRGDSSFQSQTSLSLHRTLKMIALLCFIAFIPIGFSRGNQKREESPLPEDLSGSITVKYYYAYPFTRNESNYTEIQEIIKPFNKKRTYVKLEKYSSESYPGRVEIHASGRHIEKCYYALKQYEKSKFEEYFKYSIDLLRDRWIFVVYYADPDSKTDQNYKTIEKIVTSDDKYKCVHLEKRDDKSKARDVHISKARDVHIKGFVQREEIKNGSAEFPYKDSEFKSTLDRHINLLEEGKKILLENKRY
ncbi:hypothetical protein ACOME3_010747 [Neoechinorhynchus agilis]